MKTPYYLHEFRYLKKEDDTIIATGLFQPKGNGQLGRRAVLRDLGDQYVVHTQCFITDDMTVTSAHYHEGHYIPKPKEDDGGATLRKAWESFNDRNAKIIGLPGPAKPQNVAIVTLEDNSFDDTKCIGDCAVILIDWDNMEVSGSWEVEEKISEILALGLPGDEVEVFLERLRKIADDAKESEDEDNEEDDDEEDEESGPVMIDDIDEDDDSEGMEL